MNAAPHRLLSLAVILGLTTCGTAHAQVGPSSQNVKKKPTRKAAPKPKPRRAESSPPLVRVRTVTRPKQRKPAVARVKPRVKPPVAAAIRVKPPIRVPGPNAAEIARRAAQQQAEMARLAAEREAKLAAERLAAAGAWQQEELAALERVAVLAGQAPAPNLAAVVLLDLPKAPSTTGGKTLYRQKVTLFFVREDGQPFDVAQVRRTPGPLTATATGNRLELEGPRPAAADADLQFALPADWSFMRAEDGRLSLRDYPGQESRVELSAPEAVRPVALPKSDPLFGSAPAEEAARDSIRAVEHQALAVSAYARPAGAAAAALARLVEARRVLDLFRSLPAGAPVDVRMEAWQNAERARRLLDDALLSLQEAGDALQQFSTAPVQAVLKDDYRLDYAAVRRAITTGAARHAQYAAEAAWRQSEALNPAAPDRTAAIQALEKAPAGTADLLASQLARYREAADRERRYRALIQTGALNTAPAPDVQITRHLTRTIAVQRPYVDLRFAAASLKPEDRVSLGGEPVEFTQRDGFWHGRIARARLAGNDRLRFSRKTYISELQGEMPLPRLDPYAANGNLLGAPELRPIGVRTVSVTGGAAGEIVLFRELTAEQLRELRRDSQETEGKDGLWLAHRTVPLALRLQRVGGEASDGKREKGKNERLIVAGARLEGPAAGQVGGLRVGSTQRAVENIFGTSVERTGSLKLMEGALEIVLREGLVSQIVIHREFALPVD